MFNLLLNIHIHIKQYVIKKVTNLNRPTFSNYTMYALSSTCLSTHQVFLLPPHLDSYTLFCGALAQ